MGCVNSGDQLAPLGVTKADPVPSDIRSCFKSVTPPPKPGGMSTRDTVILITNLHASERRKNTCGKRLLRQYESYR